MTESSQHLAGLAFAFEPVRLQLGRSDNKRQPSGPRRRSGERQAPAAGSGGAAAPARSVAFNLAARRPGPAYASPQPSPRQRQQQSVGSRPGSAAAAHAPPASAGLAALKLASLRRRAAAQASEPQPQPAVEEPQAAPGSPVRYATLLQPPQPHHEAETQQQQQQQDVAVLLGGLETRLAGCTASVLEEPLPEVAAPEHVLCGIPVLAVPPLPAAAVAAVAPAGDGLIAAYRPADAGSSVPPHAAAVLAAEPAAAEVPAAAADGSTAVEPAAPEGELAAVPLPQTLEEALRCLGLLEAQPAGPACTRSIVSGGAAAEQHASQPHWARLRAAAVVLESKQAAAAAAELQPLARRLRQVCLHLAFHQANLQRGRSRSPGRGGSAPPPGPWLSGRSSAGDSKHRTSRSGSPGSQLGPRPKVACPTPEASELQVQLLSSLRHKLLLKLGLAALRQAAAAAALRRRLLAHVGALEAADLSRAALLGWHAAVVPSPQQEAAALRLLQQHQLRRQRAQLAAWRQWAAHSAWQHRQLAAGLALQHRRLLAAAVLHWRCSCQAQLVERLQAALAARWAAAWGRRRVFAAWRQAAWRSAALKAALLRATSGRGAAGTAIAEQPPSPKAALAATAAAFQPVKAFVMEASQQLVQLQRSLRPWGSAGSGAAAAAAAAAAEGELLAAGAQRAEPLPLGSVESLLAALPLTKQPQLQHQDTALVAMAVMAASPLQQAAAAQPQAPAAQSEGPTAAAAAPAPDPGSPPAYNPASYASPARQAAYVQRSGQGAAVPAAAAVEGELLDCQDRVERLRQQLEALEQASCRGSQELQQQCAHLEESAAAAQEAASQRREACVAAAAAKQASAQAMQGCVQQHAAAAAECSQQERQLRQLRQESQAAAAAEAGARAAAHAAAEQRELATMGVQRWSKTVEGVARELAACHRTQQAPVAVRLKEARQRLEQQQREAAAAQEQLPQLQAAVQAAAKRAAAAQQAVQQQQQRLVQAAEQRARLKLDLDAAMASHEAAAVAAVAAEQEASAAEAQQRLLAAQQQATAGRLRQTAQQVAGKQQQAVQLAGRVQALQAEHRAAVASMLAAEGRQQRRGKLKRRLQVVQEQGGAADAAPSPTAMQQRRPAPAAAAQRGSFLLGAVAPGVAAEAECQQLVMADPAAAWADWSCSSSELGGPPSEADAPAPTPLTVEEAAARFYAHCLLRRVLRALRWEAAATRAAMQAATAHRQQRQLARVLPAWRAHTAEVVPWLAEAGTMLRRRWLLRQWQAAAAEHRTQREAEAAADALVRRRLLAAGLQAWRQHVQHERWRDAVHEAVVQQRLRSVLQSWRAWSRQRQQKAARQRAALAVYHRRLLGAALRQWRWAQHGKALLHRVFGTAAELWREEVGARLHQRNHELLLACWDGWQLAVLQAQARRRQAMLDNAAAAFRERQLLAAGLQAFRQGVADAQQERRQRWLCARLLAAWRQLAATSARHFEYEAARQQRRDLLLRLALSAWRAAAEETSGRLAAFWLRWHVQAPMRRALHAWRVVAAEQRSERALSGMAEVHRERQLLQTGLAAFAGNTPQAGCSPSGRRGSELRLSPSRPAAPHVGRQQQQQGKRHPAQQQHQHQQPLPAVRTRTTITISHGRAASPGQEQRAPAVALAQPAGSSGSSCSAAAGSSMLATVSDWRAAADYWRQRHESFAGQQQQQRHVIAQEVAQPAAVGPHTAATLQELRVRWHQLQ